MSNATPATTPAIEQIRRRLAGLPGWTTDGTVIEKTYRFADFYRTMSFVNAVAHVANVLNHHPDLAVSYSRCTVRFTTHDAGGVTETDFTAAAEVEALSLA